MAKETYKGKITRDTDWGGDVSTSGLPVCGKSIQDFLKDELGQRVGAFYKPQGGSYVYAFSTKEDKEAYKGAIESGQTPEESLVVDFFETTSNYEVIFNQDTLVLSHSVLDGQTGNTVFFQFKIVDKNGMSSDAKAKIEFSFTGSGISDKFTTEIPLAAGEWTTVSELVDDYLRTGANSVAIKIIGMSTQTTTQFIMKFNLFNLSFVPSFAFNRAQTAGTVSVGYTITCDDPKVIEFYIDGELVKTKSISDPTSSSKEDIAIDTLENGSHTLQTRAYVRTSDLETFYTPSHFYVFTKYGADGTFFLMSKEVENTQGITPSGETFNISLTQFEQIEFDWATYDSYGRRVSVIFEYDGKVVGRDVSYNNEEPHTFSYRAMEFGNKVLRAYALDENDEEMFSYTINVNVAESPSGVKETVEGLKMKLQATNRRNSDDNRDVWSYSANSMEVYYATFSGFSWSEQQGWNEETESLTISNGATVSFNIAPMINDWADIHGQGGTLELDIETFDIDDEDAVICQLGDNIIGSDSAEIKITATNIIFKTAAGIKISTRYRDNDRLKIAFIGNRKGTHEDGNLIYIVINGVLERAAMFSNSDVISSVKNLAIGDPEGKCKVRLRSIRVYNRAISVDEAFNNYVVDSDDVQTLYNANDVLADGSSTEVDFDKVANKIPVMIFTGDMHKLITEGQSTKTEGKWYHFDVEYVNRQDPARNFVSYNCRMKLQGTSSLGYPRKNFKLSTKDKDFDAEMYENSLYEIDPDTIVGNLMLRNKVTMQRIDVEDFLEGGTLHNTNCFTLGAVGTDTTQYAPLKKGKYRFRADAHKANKWTLKADYMESSCSHNVGAGRSWNDIFENTPIDLESVKKTYIDSALVESGNTYKDYYARDIEGKEQHYRVPMNTPAFSSQKKYVCRTDAQKICIAEGADDIRTAVDGFPMVCFYRTSHKSNDLVFMGQYNFINDKGSYEVFGFEDIENPEDESTMIYDSKQVECWEGLKNSNPISLFVNADDFYDFTTDGKNRKWQETYEARYPDPDDYTQDPTNLKSLTDWIISTRHTSATTYSGTLDIDSSFAERINKYQYGYSDDNVSAYTYASGTNLEDNALHRQQKFETEKWEHFDVWKLAGYYIYLMRYGAVDQFVKNTMLFTDGNGRYDPRPDGKYRKWFFINYDNDCLFGLRNNGQLAFDWKLDRQTEDNASDIIPGEEDESGSTNAYAMMGHDSTLWNNLEEDPEFMRMVRDLDDAMAGYGLNYANMVEEFDTKQTEKWCERIYNANERYKYIYAAKGIGDMSGSTVDNLWMLQGTRRSHRHWWIANHFNLLNAKWLSGDYKRTYVWLRTNCLEGVTVSGKSAEDYYYAWGEDKGVLYDSNMQAKEGDYVYFSFPHDQAQGNPVNIYAFNKMSEMDFSALASAVYEGSFQFHLANNDVQNTMKKLVIGNTSVTNNMAIDTATWKYLPNLEYLDITNYKGITNVDVDKFNNLHTYKAAGSSIGSFAPANGAKLEYVELPRTIKTLTLSDVSFASGLVSTLIYTPSTNLDTLNISNNNGIGLDYYNKLIEPWLRAIKASPDASVLYPTKSLNLSNVKWRFGSLESIRIFKDFKEHAKNFSITGVIDLRDCGNLSMENINEIKSIFGDNCFNEKTASIYVITPMSIFILYSTDNIVAGQDLRFSRELYPDEAAVIEKVTGIRYYVVEETTKTKQEGADFEDPITGKRYIILTDDEINAKRSGTTLTNYTDNVTRKQYAILSTKEYVFNTDTVFKVLVNMKTTESTFDKLSVVDITVKDPTYARSCSIEGTPSAYMNKEYTFTLFPLDERGAAPIGTYGVDWTLTGPAVDEGYVEESGVTENKLVYRIATNKVEQPPVSSTMTLAATITNFDGTQTSTSFTILVLNETVIMTKQSNPTVMRICYDEGLVRDENAMTKAQAEGIRDIGTTFQGIRENFSFYEFSYFTGLNGGAIPASAFAGSNITAIALPDNLMEIGEGAFNGCNRLSVVSVKRENEGGVTYEKTIPSGVTEISQACFRGCSSLNNLTLPSSIIKVSDYAFGGTGFKKVMLSTDEAGTGVLRMSDGLRAIEGYAYETQRWSTETTDNSIEVMSFVSATTAYSFEIVRGKNIKEFRIQEGTTNLSVRNGALFDGDGNNLIKYPAQAPYEENFEAYGIGLVMDYAFFNVQNLDAVRLGAQTIGVGVFEESKIKNIYLDNVNFTQNRLPSRTFYNCTSLENITLPNNGNIKVIGTKAFYNCPLLHDFEIPFGVEEFERDSDGYSLTFVNCHSLTKIELPETITGATAIGMHAINECSGITSIVLPKYWRYTYLGGWAVINNCKSLSSLTYPAMSIASGDPEESVVINETFWEGLFDGSNVIEEFLFAEENDGERYVSIDGCVYTADSEQWAENSRNMFVRCPSIKPVCVIAEGTKSIYASAFNTSTVYDVTMPDTLEYIGLNAFHNSPISSVTVSQGLLDIADGAFWECHNLREIELPPTVNHIGKDAFRECTSLVEIAIPVGVRSISNAILQDCTNLEKVEFLGDVYFVDRFALNGCSKLREMVVRSKFAPCLARTGLENSSSYPGGIASYHPFRGFASNGVLYISHGVSGYDYVGPQLDTPTTDPDDILFDTLASDPNIGAIIYVDEAPTRYRPNYMYIVKKEGNAYRNVDVYSPDNGEWRITHFDVLRRHENTGMGQNAVRGSWTVPLQDMYGWSVAETPVSGRIYATIYSAGTLFTGDVYYVTENGTEGASMEYVEEKGATWINDDIAGLTDGQVVNLYSDAAHTDLIGSFVAEYGKNRYTVGEPLMGSTRMLGKRLGAASLSDENDSDTVSREEYEALKAKLSRLINIVDKLS